MFKLLSLKKDPEVILKILFIRKLFLNLQNLF